MIFVVENIRTKIFRASSGKFGQQSFGLPKIYQLQHLCFHIQDIWALVTTKVQVSYFKFRQLTLQWKN